jgi:L-lactate dehydrogenase complex protein LldF
VHWAATAEEAVTVVREIAAQHNVTRFVKVKSLTTDEIGLNEAMQAVGVTAIETDLAELIVQIAAEHPSHVLVPAIHKNRSQIRDLFIEHLGAPENTTDEPVKLASIAREHLRKEFLHAKMAVSGANFAVAETGSLVVVESEGNGRMCLTLPDVLVSIVGIEKVIPEWRDLEVFMQVLPRSSTGERMNPYTTIWTGIAEDDGPSEVHIVLLDNGRSDTLAEPVGRDALMCIRCSACMNVCPVYERTGGHAYGSVYPGPIGAILTPQLFGPGQAESLPYASTLCGACYDVCPVLIDIPSILVHLRATGPHRRVERLAFSVAARELSTGRGLRRVHRISRLGQPLVRVGAALGLGPLGSWSRSRVLPRIPRTSFRKWFTQR